MDNLDKYIQNNLEQFNTGELPAGHQERFMAKLTQTQKTVRKGPFSRKAIFAATAAAAAAIIGAFIALGIPQYRLEQLNISIQELAQEMYLEETELLQMFQEDEQYMINHVKSITEEAIPLADQLPDELSPARRAEILREYYKAKTAGLRQIKTLYAQSDQPID